MEKTINKSTNFTHNGRMTVADFIAIADELSYFDEDTTLNIQSGSNQMDGDWFSVTISDAL